MATDKGHIHQTRKNLNSTNPQYPKRNYELPMTPMSQCTNTVFTKIIDYNQKIAIYITGKSPVTSNKGKNYLFVLYDYDIHFILIRPMKSQADSEFIRVFTDLHEHLLTRGIKPAYMILENEASPAFQRKIKAKNIYY